MMKISDWNISNDFYQMLEYASQYTSELEQRSVSTEYCKLLLDRFNDFEKEVLVAVKRLSEGKSKPEEHIHLLEQLRNSLKNDGKSEPASALIWALQENTDGYPAWYASAIICNNLIELKVAQNEQLCEIIRKVIPYKKLEEVEQAGQAD